MKTKVLYVYDPFSESEIREDMTRIHKSKFRELQKGQIAKFFKLTGKNPSKKDRDGSLSYKLTRTILRARGLQFYSSFPYDDIVFYTKPTRVVTAANSNQEDRSTREMYVMAGRSLVLNDYEISDTANTGQVITLCEHVSPQVLEKIIKGSYKE